MRFKGSWKNTTILIVVVRAIGAVIALTIQKVAAVGTSHDSKRLCVDRPPEYPGCTAAQLRAMEASDKDAVRRNYNKGRWGQSGSEWG